METFTKSQALSGCFAVADAEKLRGVRNLQRFIGILSGESKFKTSDKLEQYLVGLGFEVIDVDGWIFQITLQLKNIVIRIQDLPDTKTYRVMADIVKNDNPILS